MMQKVSLKSSTFLSLMFGFLMLTSCSPDIDQVMDEARERMRKGAYQEAVSVISEAIEDGADRYDMYNLRGSAYLELDKRAEALADFNKAISFKSGDYRPYYNRGNLYRRMNKPEQAFEDYSQAILRDKTQADIFLNRALVAWNLKDVGGGLADLERANFLTNGQNAQIRYYRGKILLQAERFEEAVPELLAATKLDPQNAKAHFDLVMAEAQTPSIPKETICAHIQKALEYGHADVHKAFGAFCKK